MNIPSDKVCQEKKIGSTYVFKKEIAKKYGVEAAILIQHFQYSINHHKKNGTHFYEGRYWTYDSVSSLTNLYPFWSTRTIRTIIKHLLDKNVLISGNFSKNKYERTRWFAFKDEDKFIIVDKNVDKQENPVDNHVDNIGIKNTTKHQKSNKKKSGNEPFLSKKSSETRRNDHLSFLTNRFVVSDKSLSIYSSICNTYSSSIEEAGTSNNHGGSLKKGNKRKNTGLAGKKPFKKVKTVFVDKITSGYILPYSLRKKLHELGHSDNDIDKQVLKMIRYHEQNPQIILNEHSCVLGWFENSLKKKF